MSALVNHEANGQNTTEEEPILLEKHVLDQSDEENQEVLRRARERIEQHRKVDVRLDISDADGTPYTDML